MKNKIIKFLIVIPLIIMLLYSLCNYQKVELIWYFLILYTGILGLITSIYLIYHKVDLKSITKEDRLPFILLIVFLLFAILSTLHSSNIGLSLLGSDYRRDGLYSYFSYIGIGLISMFVINSKEKNDIYKLFVFVGLILTIFTRLEFNNFLYPIQYSYNSIFFQFNHFSYFLILCIICSICLFINSSKLYYLISTGLMIELLIQNNTFGGYIAVLITIIFIIFYHLLIKKNYIKPLIILCFYH